jgi:hypothetical protein
MYYGIEHCLLRCFVNQKMYRSNETKNLMVKGEVGAGAGAGEGAGRERVKKSDSLSLCSLSNRFLEGIYERSILATQRL